MPTVTIKIAPQGTGFRDGSNIDMSIAGHGWYSIKDNYGNSYSYGFNSKNVSTTDDIDYVKNKLLGKVYEKEISISEKEFSELKRFGDYYSRKSDVKPNLDFDMNYNVFNNSCIDFTWRALESAGLNPKGFQGNLTPIENINNFEKLGNKINQGLRGNDLGDYDKDTLGRGVLEVLSRLGFGVQALFAGFSNFMIPDKEIPFDPFNFPYIPDNDGTTKPLDPYAYPNIFPQVYDPLTLDLNNDGKISTLNLGDGVYFDHNGDKIAFKTSWIGKEDGILVFDKNNNGLIDNGNELFGNFTEISNSQTLNNPNNQISNSQISNNPSHNTPLNQSNPNKQTSNLDNSNSQTSILNSQTKFAINGYHALAMQDSNGDGKIDTFDEIFSNLKIWQDLNEDGISQANELKTLDEHGIKSISLNFNKPKNSDILKDSSDIFKRQKFIQNLKKLTTSNQIVTKKIYNFKSYEFVA